MAPRALYTRPVSFQTLEGCKVQGRVRWTRPAQSTAVHCAGSAPRDHIPGRAMAVQSWHHSSWSYALQGTSILFVSPSDAPGATPDAAWEGNIRATKWRTEEGNSHKGCTGKESDGSPPVCGVLGLEMCAPMSGSHRAQGAQAGIRQFLLQGCLSRLLWWILPQEPRVLPLSCPRGLSQREIMGPVIKCLGGTRLMANQSGANTWGVGSCGDHYLTAQS